MSSEVQVCHPVVVELLKPVPEYFLLRTAPTTPRACDVTPGRELKQLIRILPEIF